MTARMPEAWSPRTRVLLVGVPIAVLSLMGLAAAAFTPILVRDAPELLLVLESRNRYLLLVAARVSLVAFVGIGLPRRLASDPLFFVLGRWYGDRAVEWVVERTPGSAATVGRLRRAADRADDVLVLAAPGSLVSVLAGANGMSWPRFLTLNATGTFGALGVLWWTAGRAAGPLAALVEVVDRNAGGLTALTAALVVGWAAWSSRGGGAVDDVRSLADPEERDTTAS